MGLFTPAYLKKNENVALKAVMKLTDHQKLYQAAMNSPNERVCLAATRRIVDQELLFQIARLSCKEAISLEAVQKIADQQMLCKLLLLNVLSDAAQDAAFDKLSDEAILLRIAQEALMDGTRIKAVQRMMNQDELVMIMKEDSSGYVRAEAIKKLDDNRLDLSDLLSIAMNACNEYSLPAEDGEAAVDRIYDENCLLEIALKAQDFSVRIKAAEKLKEHRLIMEYLIHTEDDSSFKTFAKRITDPKDRERILNEAQIKNTSVLKCLFTDEELLNKCIEKRDASMIESVYMTWDVDSLNKLKEFCTDNSLAEKINLRLKTVEHMNMLQEKGFPAKIDGDMDQYIDSLNNDISRYSTAKRVVAAQGRWLDFDRIYDQSDLQGAVSSAAGISLSYFLGGPLLSGFLLMPSGPSLVKNAKDAVWPVIASLQLADSDNVLQRLTSDISQEDAAKLIHDILKLWYDKIA